MSTMTDDFQGAISMATHLGKRAATERGDAKLTEDDRLDLCAEMRVESWGDIRPGHRKKFEVAFRKAFNDEISKLPKRGREGDVTNETERTNLKERLADTNHHRPDRRSSDQRRRRTAPKRSSPSRQLEERTRKVARVR